MSFVDCNDETHTDEHKIENSETTDKKQSRVLNLEALATLHYIL
jgi:hypothetical protein